MLCLSGSLVAMSLVWEYKNNGGKILLQKISENCCLIQFKSKNRKCPEASFRCAIGMPLTSCTPGNRQLSHTMADSSLTCAHFYVIVHLFCLASGKVIQRTSSLCLMRLGPHPHTKMNVLLYLNRPARSIYISVDSLGKTARTKCEKGLSYCLGPTQLSLAYNRNGPGIIYHVSDAEDRE